MGTCRRRLALAVVVMVAMTACSPASHRKTQPTVTATAATLGRPTAGLVNSHPCGVPGFTCSTLTVLVDRSRASGRTLGLNVAVSDNRSAKRGVLLLLTGGPGQPGAGLLARSWPRIAYLLKDYRLVMIDQRGTGSTAVDCPELQDEVGSSDILPPARAAVAQCAETLGADLTHYTTTDTVADLDELRAALGADTWTLDGISYGTYVAQRYAYAHPSHVTRMVLDSVVPATGAPADYADSMRRTADVLRAACAEAHCAGDPVSDLAKLVDAGNGYDLMNFIVTATIVDPSLAGNGYYPVLDLLHSAGTGKPEPLRTAMADLDADRVPATDFSAGLHIATLCAEIADAPWGAANTPQPRAVLLPSNLTDDSVYPFDTKTVVQQGLIAACRFWPATTPPPVLTGTLTMPVLLVAGDRDLSTPLAWAKGDLSHFTHAKLTVVGDMGHSIQGRNPDGDAAVTAFLLAGA